MTIRLPLEGPFIPLHLEVREMVLAVLLVVVVVFQNILGGLCLCRSGGFEEGQGVLARDGP